MKYGYPCTVLASLSLLFGASAGASTALGTENALGNAMNPSGSNPLCYPSEYGLNPLAQAPARTPTGWLYDVPCKLPDVDTADTEGWKIESAIEVGIIGNARDDEAYYYNEYADWSDGPMISYLEINGEKQGSADYFNVYGGGLGRDDQFLGLEAGRYGSFKLTAHFNQIPHLMGRDATAYHQGAGSDNLTLRGGFLPGAGSPASLTGLVDISPATDLTIDRQRTGLGLSYQASPNWELFGNYNYEERQGTKAYGGAFFFAFAIPGFGSINELIQPVDYGTHDLNLGTYLKGDRWALNLTYTGSFFSNDNDTLTWENPFFTPSLAPPPGGDFVPTQGRIDLYPDNDFNHLKGVFSYQFGNTGSWVTTVAIGQMSQDDNLVPYTISAGAGGTFPAQINYDDWNTIAALPRTSADAEINTQLFQTKASFSPRRSLRLRAELRYYEEDNKTQSFETRNMQTGDVGYIVTDGGLGSTVPFEHYVFQPGVPGAPFHYRSIPFGYDQTEFKVGADWRLNKTKLTGEIERVDTDREHREIPTTEETTARLIAVLKYWDAATLRLLGEYSERDWSGSYDYNPYEPFYTSALPGYVPPMPAGAAPHTLESLIKHDIAERDKASLEARLNLLLSDRVDGFVSVQYDDKDYQASHGLLDDREMTVNTELSYAPGQDGTWFVFASWQQRDWSQANINDAGANLGIDPAPGSLTYPLANGWLADHDEQTLLVGAGYSRMIYKAELSLNYSFSSSATGLEYQYNSPAALASPTATPGEIGNEFPTIDYDRHVLEANLNMPVTPAFDVRLYYRLDKGKIDDFHFTNMTELTAGRNAIYLGLEPDDWTSHTVGMFAQYRF